MQIAAPRSSSFPMIQLASNASSASKASNSIPLDQWRNAHGIITIAWQQPEPHRIADRVGQGEDFRGPSTLRLANCLILSPLLHHARNGEPERW